MSTSDSILTSGALPIIVGIIVAVVSIVVGRSLNLFDKTSQKSTFATFNITTLQRDVDDFNKKIEATDKKVEEIKQYIDKKVDYLIELIEKKDERVRHEIDRQAERTSAIMSKTEKSEWRLDSIERKGSSSASLSMSPYAGRDDGLPSPSSPSPFSPPSNDGTTKTTTTTTTSTEKKAGEGSTKL